jgi:hypothetical protein
MKDHVYGVLVLGPLNQNYKGVPTVYKHENHQYQGKEPTKFGPDHLLAFEFQTYAFAKYIESFQHFIIYNKHFTIYIVLKKLFYQPRCYRRYQALANVITC